MNGVKGGRGEAVKAGIVMAQQGLDKKKSQGGGRGRGKSSERRQQSGSGREKTMKE